MGCRICIEAPLDTMPLDFAVLLRSTPAPVVFAPITSRLIANQSIIDGSRNPEVYACRRVATYPMVNKNRAPKLSTLKYRSLSDCTDLRAFANQKFYTNLDGHVFSASFNCEVPFEFDRSEQDDAENHVENFEIPEISIVHTEKAGNLERSKTRKKVAFADDRGLQLATVRVMSEPSDVPPKIDYSAIMRSLLGEQWTDDEAVAKPCATWVVNFKQPASDYLAYRQKLDTNMVALENVLVKNDHCQLMGTVKVKNLCFDKQVFIRYTDNDWKSYFDRPCKYSCTKGNPRSALNDSYDTFQFELEIPCDDSQHQKLEFCLCYRPDNGQEYWDNNEGKNFEIISEHLRLQRCQLPQANLGGEKKESKNWTEFASWTDLATGESAYW